MLLVIVARLLLYCVANSNIWQLKKWGGQSLPSLPYSYSLAAEAGNRRVLSCATLTPVIALWEEALDCKLAEKGLNKSVLLGGEGFPAVSMQRLYATTC